MVIFTPFQRRFGQTCILSDSFRTCVLGPQRISHPSANWDEYLSSLLRILSRSSEGGAADNSWPATLLQADVPPGHAADRSAYVTREF